ncbi:glycoside hydrolase family 125 protein [Parathielavia hyrcaniae]|uniref:Glycoside hydrolase family 125 protein n=1 Tax=Parathielavia hyrcaniae TaxID=113614 RepID=A0AAN6T5R8_9PEZI|nr:glycoside hydrolase family 125 protein [Parathielavia hyrcaniae]
MVLWLGYQTPSSTVHAPFDLRPDPPPNVPGVQNPGKDHTGPSHSNPAQGVGTAENSLYPPTTPGSSNDSDEDGEVVLVDIILATGGSSSSSSSSSSIPTTTTAAAESAVPTPAPTVQCLGFEELQRQKPGPPSEGRRKFPYVRPPPECRKFRLPALEALLERMEKVIRDPDLFRLFENSYPNTLDTMIKWRGYAKKKDHATGEEVETDEELTYVITGDIDAMWLRDSASQVYSYLPLLEASREPDSLASLWRGLINAHARYIIISPYCHSFQPPPESGIQPTNNGAYLHNHPNPPYNPTLVFDCKWELDSLASFLQVSAAYYTRTGDLDFFAKYSWVDAVQAAVDASAAMRLGTYDDEGHVLPSAWTFTGWTNRGSETLTNDGLGNPVKENGMVRSAFRPSDDACIFQLLTPSNMMFAAYLEQASHIMQGLTDRRLSDKAANLTTEMRKLATGIRGGIARDAVVRHRDFGEIFAYEVDGYGGANLMDDANVPSLLAMPLWNYTLPAAMGKQLVKSVKQVPRDEAAATDTSQDAEPSSMASHSRSKRPASTAGDTEPPTAPRTFVKATKDDSDSEPATKTSNSTSASTGEDDHQADYAAIYQNTRKFVLSMANPYFAKGPALSAVGGPHLGPGKGWPMAVMVAALTAFEDVAGFASSPRERDEVVAEQLYAVLNSTAGTGVVHETVNAWNEADWTRSWFGWANGLFGELIIRIAEDEQRRGLLGTEEGLLGRSWQH